MIPSVPLCVCVWADGCRIGFITNMAHALVFSFLVVVLDLLAHLQGGLEGVAETDEHSPGKATSPTQVGLTRSQLCMWLWLCLCLCLWFCMCVLLHDYILLFLLIHH